MLKIPKGLKKKKKGKKSKRKEEDELFDSAELEKYRREQQLKQEAAASAVDSSEVGEGDGGGEKGEEWEKFKALTSGVDDILNKTKGDLDRIKSTSYFQKKPPGPSASTSSSTPGPSASVAREEVKTEAKSVSNKGKWVGFDENSVDVEGVEESSQVEEAVTREEPVKEEEEEEEEESEFENDQDDIFDTSYVDVVAAGEVKLVYVPDSPEKQEEDDDPFDTSIVDKVIKPEVQKKALIGFTLGSAVEVLAGKAEKPRVTLPVEVVKPQRRRPRPQNLLLGSFDEGTAPPPDVQVEPQEVPKSILDEDPVFEEQTSEILGLPPVTPVGDLSPVPPSRLSKEPSPKGLDLKDLVSEFEPSLVTPSPVVSSLVVEDDLEDEFTELAKSSTQKPLPSAEPNELNFEEDDPFDTSFASKILPGKFELKLIENEVLSAEVEAVADPAQKLKEVLSNTELRSKVPERPPKPSLLSPAAPLKKDLLGGSTSDLSKLGEVPIAPKSETEENEFDLEDPFDTSVVDKIVAPGKTELKFLEKELLDSVQTEDLDDFDPRAEEIVAKPTRPDSLVASKRASIPKVVAFDVKSPSKLPDLLGANQDNDKVSKPLTPYYPPANVEPRQNDDPFDTSIVRDAPGKYEIQLLEKQLAEAPLIPPARKLSDPDFDPRHGEPDKVSGDIISGGFDCNSKLHTPVVPRKAFNGEDEPVGNDLDPFDTSIVSGLVPGKAEVRVLETELIHSTIPQPTVSISAATEELLKKSRQNSSESRKSVTDVLEQASSDDITAKPLTPALVSSDSFEFDDDADPFDTSAVEKILPGKTEIKILESELLSN